MRSIVRTSLACLAFILGGCFAASDPTTESGKGLPEVSVEFPEVVDAGSVETASVEVTNPGPGDMTAVTVSFSLVGVAGTEELPRPLVGVRVAGREGSIADVAPEPRSVSDDGVVYVFDALAEGETATYDFDIRVPNVNGTAANSVVVYDSQDVERARGVRLSATVQR